MNQRLVIPFLCNSLIVLSACLPNSLFSQNSDSLIHHKLDSLFSITFDSLDASQLDSFKAESIELMRKLFNEDGLDDLIENKLPFFALEDADEHLISPELFKGKISIVHLWSIYSQPSIDQIPLINQLAEAHQDSVNIFTITRNSRIEIRDYVYNYNYNHTHLVDAGSYMKKLGIKQIPKILILDEDLVLKAIYNLNDYGSTYLFDEITAKIKKL